MYQQKDKRWLQKNKLGEGRATLEELMYGASHGKRKIYGFMEIQKSNIKYVFYVK